MGAGICGPLRHAGDGARLNGLSGASGAVRLCHERRLQHRFGHRHGNRPSVRGGHGRGGVFALQGRRRAGRKTRLCHEFRRRQRFGDRHDHDPSIRYGHGRVGLLPVVVAFTPDGTHVYVENSGASTISVIDTTTIPPSVTATVAGISGGLGGGGVAVTPDGKHVYVTSFTGIIFVIDTTTTPPSLVANISTAAGSNGVAVTPDGTHVYVADNSIPSNNVSVIATATNTVVATVPLSGAFEVAITPDGKHAYVTGGGSGGGVSVIDTTTSPPSVTATVAVAGAYGVAITPDGKHVYVTNDAVSGGTVSVIDTATNTVEAATVAVGSAPTGVGIVSPPPGVPFLVFCGPVINIALGSAPNTDAFTLGSSITLSSTAPAINPLTDTVTLNIGTFAITIPPGSYKKNHLGYIFTGVINGVTLQSLIKPTGTLRYEFQAKAQGASFTGTTNPAYVTLTVGGGSGATSVTAKIFGTSPAVTAAKFH